LQLGVLSHQANRHRHALGGFAQGHLAVRGKTVWMTHRTTEHDDADMAVDGLCSWHRVAVFQRTEQGVWHGQNPSSPKTTSPNHNMATAALRQRTNIHSAMAHQRASQNMGWVMADSSFENMNMGWVLVIAKHRR
jgi:hypothetical protein